MSLRDLFFPRPPQKLNKEWLDTKYPGLAKQLPDDEYLIYLLALLLDRWDYHVEKVETARNSCNVIGWLLVFAIPICSTFVTWATNGGDWLIRGRVLGLISLLLTLLTFVSSILKPLQRTTQADHQLVALYTWRYKLLCELRVATPSHVSDFAAYLSARDAELSQIGNQMVNTLTTDDSSLARNGSQNTNSEASGSGKENTSAPKADV